MRIAASIAVLSLAASVLAAQDKPPAATSRVSAATHVRATSDPCAPKQEPLAASKMTSTVLNVRAVAAAAAQAIVAPVPKQVMQNVDPAFAMNFAWQEASDEVMKLLESRHPLTDDDKKAIADFDSGHPVREQFLFRTNLLRDAIKP